MEERKMKPRPRKSRRKVCGFCVDKVEHIDFKDTAKLRRFLLCSRKRGFRRVRKSSLHKSHPVFLFS